MTHPARPSGYAARASGYRKLILSVDDEQSILETREMLLASAGYDVLSAIDGQQALSMLLANPVDLVLLDYQMPALNGEVVARRMKQSRSGVPVIFVSASSIPSEALHCADGLLEKGNGPTILLEKIGELLKKAA